MPGDDSDGLVVAGEGAIAHGRGPSHPPFLIVVVVVVAAASARPFHFPILGTLDSRNIGLIMSHSAVTFTSDCSVRLSE